MSWVLAAALAVLATGLAVRLREERRLAAHASHELRGPLSAAQLALEALDAPPDRVFAVEAQLRRARLALDDLAEAPRGSRAPDRLEPVSVSGFVGQIALAWRPVAAARGTELRVQWPAAGGAMLLADRVRLAQAAGNLVANALDHGEGPVELRARCAGERLRLEVRDAGPGLPASVAALRERGHGLTIASGIAARHGGRLTAAPSARGAALVLELPLHAAAEEAAE
jgi:signal transduction histidine kinase